MSVFENRVLRQVFGPKRDEVTRESRKLHNDELNDLYFSPDIIRVIKSWRMVMGGRGNRHVACTRDRGGAYRVLVGRPEGKGPRGRHKREWEDSIKIDLQEVG